MADRSVNPFTLGQATAMPDGALEVGWFLSKEMSDRYILVRCDIDEMGQSFVMRFEPVRG